MSDESGFENTTPTANANNIWCIKGKLILDMTLLGPKVIKLPKNILQFQQQISSYSTDEVISGCCCHWTDDVLSTNT